MEFLSYEDIELAEVLTRIPRKGRDRMQFGIIELDLRGTIMAYNMGEAKVSTGKSAERRDFGVWRHQRLRAVECGGGQS